MTIKKNFLLLSTTIIAIPLLSILFILVHNYLRSPNRLLINGTKEFNEIQDSYFSKSDIETLKRILSNLPPNVETVLFSEENEILLSSIPDFKLGEKIESQNLMKIINDSSDKYFYQFTTPSLEKTKTLLMTRITNIHREKRGNFFRNNLIKSLIFFKKSSFVITPIVRLTNSPLRKYNKVGTDLIEYLKAKSSASSTFTLMISQLLISSLVSVENISPNERQGPHHGA